MDRPCSLLCCSYVIGHLTLLRGQQEWRRFWALNLELFLWREGGMDSPPKVKHERTDKSGSKPMNKCPTLKFCERSRAPAVWCVRACMCVRARVQECSWGGNDLCLAWVHYAGTPPLLSPLASSQLRGSRRGSSGLYHQRKNSSVWLEETVHEKWWQGVRRRKQVRKHFHLLSRGQWAPIREP